MHREPVSWVARLATEEIPVHSSSTTAPAPPMLFSIWPPWPSINANAYLLYAFWAKHALAYCTADHLWYFELVATHATACTSLPFGLFEQNLNTKWTALPKMCTLCTENTLSTNNGNLCESLIESTKGCKKPVILFFAEIFWQIDQSLLGFNQSKMISRWLLVASTLHNHLQFRTKGAMLAALVVLVATF